jgi:hypothetical protein
MAGIRITRELAFAASLDEGNRSMCAGGRTEWFKEDQLVATRYFNRLWPRCEHNIDPEDFCFFCDGDSRPAGLAL